MLFRVRQWLDMKTEDTRTCPSCGSEFSGAVEFCPVCSFRKALAGGVESGESSLV
jgi:rubrerythrin